MQLKTGDSRAAPSSVYHIGSAGWSIPTARAADFSGDGTHLERYARRLSAVEINSCFYRSHRPETYARWASHVPSHFRFAVKAPKQITHEQRLRGCSALVERFAAETASLGEQLGPWLIQLPPSLTFDDQQAGTFLETLRRYYSGDVAWEPRHETWFTPAAERLLTAYRVARVAADPAVTPAAVEPGGWPGLVYYRLHGSPRKYYSAYSDDDVSTLASKLVHDAAVSRTTWCIFDNTALGAALENALQMADRLNAAALVASSGRSGERGALASW